MNYDEIQKLENEIYAAVVKFDKISHDQNSNVKDQMAAYDEMNRLFYRHLNIQNIKSK